MREAHQVRELPQELGELGQLIDAWASSQRFRPTQAEMAKELKVSPQQVSNWMRGHYKLSLKPIDVQRVVDMIASPGDDKADIRDQVLQAMLRDTGHLPPRGRTRFGA